MAFLKTQPETSWTDWTPDAKTGNTNVTAKVVTMVRTKYLSLDQRTWNGTWRDWPASKEYNLRSTTRIDQDHEQKDVTW